MMKIAQMEAAVLLLVFTVLAGGCAYTLRYSVETRIKQAENAREGDRSFYMKKEQVTGELVGLRETEKVSDILEKALMDLGWRKEAADKASFKVGIEAFSEKKKELEDPLLDTVFAGIHPGSGGRIFPGGRLYYTHHIEINISPVEGMEGPVWICRISTKKVGQDLLSLGTHMIPSALSYYPEEGSWELKQNVYLHMKRDE